MIHLKTNTLRVLTVDDSQIIDQGLSDHSFIELIGNAFTVQAALYLIQQEKPHIVVLDISFKNAHIEENGINLLVTIKEKYPHIKVIMLTNLNAAFYHKICMDAGADYFLDKSLDFHKIPELILKYKTELLEKS